MSAAIIDLDARRHARSMETSAGRPRPIEPEQHLVSMLLAGAPAADIAVHLASMERIGALAEVTIDQAARIRAAYAVAAIPDGAA